MNQIPTISREFKAEGIKNLNLTTFAGDIQLIGHEESTVKIEVFVTVRSILSLFLMREYLPEVSMNILDFSTIQEGTTLKIFAKPRYSNPYNWINFLKTSFRVYLPPSITSLSKTYGGDIEVKNIEGNHTFSTWGGDLNLISSKGIFEGRTMGGKIEIKSCEATVEAKTMGGTIILANNQGDFKVKTMGGKIIVAAQKGKVNAKTAGGNIEINDFEGELECSTSGGKIKLWNVAGNIGASTGGGNITVEAKSINQYLWLDTSGGRIKAYLPLSQNLNLDLEGTRVVFPNLQAFDGYKSYGQINGRLNGGGGANVKIRTSGGSVKIYENQSPAPNGFEKSEQRTETPINSIQEPTKSIPQNNNFIPKSEPIKTSENRANYSNNWFFTLAFCLVLGYGLNSIIYFTLEVINPLSEYAAIYKGVFYTNVANGIGSFCGVFTFILLLERFILEHRLRPNWIKYVIVSAITMVYVVILQMLVGIFYWRTIDLSKFSGDRNNDGTIYTLMPIVVSCAYLWYWQRNRQMNRKISEQEYQLLNLEKLKSKAQLDALEARINPHFLYNSLNSITELIHTAPDKAEEMTIQLSKLFRYTTGRNEANFHAISEELEIIKAYLAIEQIRFGNRLNYKIDCEKGIENQQISRFLLQPLVENG